MKVLFFLTALIVELALLIEFGRSFGTSAALSWVVLALAFGLWLGRAQVRRMAFALGTGTRRPFSFFGPGASQQQHMLHDAGLILASAVLFALPGLVSDAFAAMLLVPPVRRLLLRRLGAPASRSTGRPAPEARQPARQANPDVEIIPPGLLPSPFGRRTRVIDVD